MMFFTWFEANIELAEHWARTGDESVSARLPARSAGRQSWLASLATTLGSGARTRQSAPRPAFSKRRGFFATVFRTKRRQPPILVLD